MPKKIEEIKVTHPSEKVTINDHVLQQGMTPARMPTPQDMGNFSAPLPPGYNGGFNMGTGGMLPSQDPAAFAARNPNYPYPNQPMPGDAAHELAMHNQFGQGKLIQPAIQAKKVEIPDAKVVFINFFHKGMKGYKSRMFSRAIHGKNFQDLARQFAENPGNAWWSHLGGWVFPTASEQPMHDVIQ
jgi:hypothetical protein